MRAESDPLGVARPYSGVARLPVERLLSCSATVCISINSRRGWVWGNQLGHTFVVVAWCVSRSGMHRDGHARIQYIEKASQCLLARRHVFGSRNAFTSSTESGVVYTAPFLGLQVWLAPTANADLLYGEVLERRRLSGKY